MSAQTGSDVSKKLKAAIRAKLEELGVYVDDELPDYIMVMIANKKEKSHMKDDLGLFIGKSTAKFVDWLFDLFDRLQSASTKAAGSKSEENENAEEDKKNKEVSDRKRQDEKNRKEREEKEREKERQKEHDREKERLAEREKEKEKERERERERERDRTRQSEQRKRDRETREKKRDEERTRNRRSRSATYSDAEDTKKSRRSGDKHREHESRPKERKRVASTVVSKPRSPSPDQKVHSTVTVKRNIRPPGDNVNAKARSSMFLRAMNEASVSAGYGASSKKENREDAADDDEDDMSDLDALPTKITKVSKSKRSIRDRMTRKSDKSGSGEEREDERMDDDAVVLDNSKPTVGGPQMIIKLTGGQEAIKKLRLTDRIVVRGNDEEDRRQKLKRKVDKNEDREDLSDEPKSKHDRIIFDLSPVLGKSSESSNMSNSPILKKWDGQIQLNDESETSDEEAQIDFVLAQTREMSQGHYEDELPPTQQLAGGVNFVYPINSNCQNFAPAYIPTPISSQHSQQMSTEDEPMTKERCVFWPKCTKKENCQYHHPVRNCTNFPKCSFGARCYFIHPACKYDNYCKNKQCVFVHYGLDGVNPAAPVATHSLTLNKRPPMVSAAPQVKTSSETSKVFVAPNAAAEGNLASIRARLAESLNVKNRTAGATTTNTTTTSAPSSSQGEVVAKEEKTAEPVKKSILYPNKPIAEVAALPLTGMIPCRFAGACRNPVCSYKHPKECRFGAECRNHGCYFYHKPSLPPQVGVQSNTSDGGAKYKWTATASS